MANGQTENIMPMTTILGDEGIKMEYLTSWLDKVYSILAHSTVWGATCGFCVNIVRHVN